MKYIFLNSQEGSFTILEAPSPIKAIKKYHQDNCFDEMSNKAFLVLCDSGKITLPELITYANHHDLCNYNAIEKIFALGEEIL